MCSTKKGSTPQIKYKQTFLTDTIASMKVVPHVDNMSNSHVLKSKSPGGNKPSAPSPPNFKEKVRVTKKNRYSPYARPSSSSNESCVADPRQTNLKDKVLKSVPGGVNGRTSTGGIMEDVIKSFKNLTRPPLSGFQSEAIDSESESSPCYSKMPKSSPQPVPKPHQAGTAPKSVRPPSIALGIPGSLSSPSKKTTSGLLKNSPSNTNNYPMVPPSMKKSLKCSPGSSASPTSPLLGTSSRSILPLNSPSNNSPVAPSYSPLSGQSFVSESLSENSATLSLLSTAPPKHFARSSPIAILRSPMSSCKSLVKSSSLTSSSSPNIKVAYTSPTKPAAKTSSMAVLSSSTKGMESTSLLKPTVKKVVPSSPILKTTPISFSKPAVKTSSMAIPSSPVIKTVPISLSKKPAVKKAVPSSKTALLKPAVEFSPMASSSSPVLKTTPISLSKPAVKTSSMAVPSSPVIKAIPISLSKKPAVKKAVPSSKTAILKPTVKSSPMVVPSSPILKTAPVSLSKPAVKSSPMAVPSSPILKTAPTSHLQPAVKTSSMAAPSSPTLRAAGHPKQSSLLRTPSSPTMEAAPISPLKKSPGKCAPMATSSPPKTTSDCTEELTASTNTHSFSCNKSIIQSPLRLKKRRLLPKFSFKESNGEKINRNEFPSSSENVKELSTLCGNATLGDSSSVTVKLDPSHTETIKSSQSLSSLSTNELAEMSSDDIKTKKKKRHKSKKMHVQRKSQYKVDDNGVILIDDNKHLRNDSSSDESDDFLPRYKKPCFIDLTNPTIDLTNMEESPMTEPGEKRMTKITSPQTPSRPRDPDRTPELHPHKADNLPCTSVQAGSSARKTLFHMPTSVSSGGEVTPTLGLTNEDEVSHYEDISSTEDELSSEGSKLPSFESILSMVDDLSAKKDVTSYEDIPSKELSSSSLSGLSEDISVVGDISDNEELNPPVVENKTNVNLRDFSLDLNSESDGGDDVFHPRNGERASDDTSNIAHRVLNHVASIESTKIRSGREILKFPEVARASLGGVANEIVVGGVLSFGEGPVSVKSEVMGEVKCVVTDVVAQCTGLSESHDCRCEVPKHDQTSVLCPPACGIMASNNWKTPLDEVRSLLAERGLCTELVVENEVKFFMSTQDSILMTRLEQDARLPSQRLCFVAEYLRMFTTRERIPRAEILSELWELLWKPLVSGSSQLLPEAVSLCMLYFKELLSMHPPGQHKLVDQQYLQFVNALAKQAQGGMFGLWDHIECLIKSPSTHLMASFLIDLLVADLWATLTLERSSPPLFVGVFWTVSAGNLTLPIRRLIERVVQLMQSWNKSIYQVCNLRNMMTLLYLAGTVCSDLNTELILRMNKLSSQTQSYLIGHIYCASLRSKLIDNLPEVKRVHDLYRNMFDANTGMFAKGVRSVCLLSSRNPEQITNPRLSAGYSVVDHSRVSPPAAVVCANPETSERPNRVDAASPTLPAQAATSIKHHPQNKNAKPHAMVKPCLQQMVKNKPVIIPREACTDMGHSLAMQPSVTTLAQRAMGSTCSALPGHTQPVTLKGDMPKKGDASFKPELLASAAREMKKVRPRGASLDSSNLQPGSHSYKKSAGSNSSSRQVREKGKESRKGSFDSSTSRPHQQSLIHARNLFDEKNSIVQVPAHPHNKHSMPTSHYHSSTNTSSSTTSNHQSQSSTNPKGRARLTSPNNPAPPSNVVRPPSTKKRPESYSSLLSKLSKGQTDKAKMLLPPLGKPTQKNHQAHHLPTYIKNNATISGKNEDAEHSRVKRLKSVGTVNRSETSSQTSSSFTSFCRCCYLSGRTYCRCSKQPHSSNHKQ